MEDNNNKEEKMELKHEAVPGYPLIFYTAFGLATAYLIFLFVKYLH